MKMIIVETMGYFSAFEYIIYKESNYFMHVYFLVMTTKPKVQSSLLCFKDID